MARSHVDILADRFEERFAPLLDAAKELPGGFYIKPGGYGESVTARSMALTYAGRVVSLAGSLIPDARKRSDLLNWPDLARLWSFTDHGIPSHSDNILERATSMAAGLLALAQMRQGGIQAIEWGEADVLAAVRALRGNGDPGAARIAAGLEDGSIRPMGDRLQPNRMGPTVAPDFHFDELDEKRALVGAIHSRLGGGPFLPPNLIRPPVDGFDAAIDRWPPRECVRLMAALRLATASDVSATMVRTPTAIVETIMKARSGQIEGDPFRLSAPPPKPKDSSGKTFPVAAITHWVLSTSGCQVNQTAQLSLPIDQYLSPGTQPFETAARNVLSGSLLRLWLACWALADEDPYPNVDGGFSVDPRRVLLDLMGLEPRRNKSKGRLYERPTDKAEQQLAQGLRTLQEVQICRIGNITVSPGPQPMLTRYGRDDGSGDAVYQHAPVAMIALRAGRPDSPGFASYTQVPRAVMRLDAVDTPIAIAVAQIWRSKFTRDVQRGPGHVRATLDEFAKQTGAFNAGGARKDGRAYWTKLAERLEKVCAGGELGLLHVAGTGPDAIVTLTPSDAVAHALAGLQAAQEAARARALQRHDTKAVVAATMRRRRPGRPRKPS